MVEFTDMEKNKRRFITSVYFQDLFAIPLAKKCIQLGISANTVTIIGLLTSFLSGYFFLKAYFVTGSLLFGLALIIDSTDGRVARGTNTFSDFGAILDSVADKFRSIFVAFFLLIGLELTINEVIFYYSLYIFLPVTRFVLNIFLNFKDDPTIIFWDSTPFQKWFNEKGIFGFYTGWERSVMCLSIAPLTAYTLEIFTLAILLEIFLYLVGLIIHLTRK